MPLTFNDRPSDSPFVEVVWRSQSDAAGTFLSVAASHLELAVTRHQGRTFLTVRGPETKPTPADCPARSRGSHTLTLHQIVQPVIHVSEDGRSARLRARLMQMTSPAGGEGSWLSGIYENTAVDEDGTWKLSGMDLDYVWTSPSRGGWARVTTPPTAPQVPMASEFPPDRPLPGSIAAPFPKVHAMPFHYRNPVSGRVPPVLLP